MVEEQAGHEVVDGLDDEALAIPVGRCLSSSTAKICAWTVEALGIGVGNPVSLGVYRVTGTAEDERGIHPWSLILKVAQSPANVGMTDMGEGPDESHWNYWRREPLLFASGLLNDLPAGFVAPRFYGWSERPGNRSWLWLEDVADSRTNWSPARYELAALHLGRFNGAYLAQRDLPAYRWLSRRAARQVIEGTLPVLPSIEDRVPGIRDHPVIRFMRTAAPVLDALEGLPQTFCHLDAGYPNLMSRPGPTGGEETIAIDWALAGISPVGADLSQLVVDEQSTTGFGVLDNESALFHSYCAGLRDAGWDGDPDLVRFGYLAFLVCRLSGFLLYMLWLDLERGARPAVADTPLSALVPFIEQVQRATR